MRALLFFILACLPVTTSANDAFPHSAFDAVLLRFVNGEGLVDYKALKDDSDQLNFYVGLLGTVSPDNAPERFPSPQHRLAYWINAYNALALSSVVEAYPVKSVRDIKWFYGFFNRTKHIVGQEKFTLKHIEHEIIRARFKDPRIHAGLNCASMGCPKLPQKAYFAETLDADLERHMTGFVREARNVRIDRENKRVYLSDLFRQFESDFTDWYRQQHGVERVTVLDYIGLYLPASEAAYLANEPNIDIVYLKYDWRLNDQTFSR